MDRTLSKDYSSRSEEHCVDLLPDIQSQKDDASEERSLASPDEFPVIPELSAILPLS